MAVLEAKVWECGPMTSSMTLNSGSQWLVLGSFVDFVLPILTAGAPQPPKNGARVEGVAKNGILLLSWNSIGGPQADSPFSCAQSNLGTSKAVCIPRHHAS